MNVGAGTIDRATHGGIVVNRDYAPVLRHHGLLDFDSIFGFTGGRTVKRIPPRTVVRMAAVHSGRQTVFYLKRHVGARPPFSALAAHWLFGRPCSPGLAEFENICDFRNSGFQTAAPVAAGERSVGFFRYESFLITENFEPYVSLETIIRRHPEMLRGPEGVVRKSRIIAAIGRLARAMHRAGLNHRDFNATHVLIEPESSGGTVPPALFDMQRIDRKRWMRFHWMIKTLAELNYSMPAPLFDHTDRWQLYRAYRENDATGRLDRLRFFLIMRKMRRIEKHTEKIMRRRAAQEGSREK